MNDIVVKTDKFEINNKNLVLGKQGENIARQIVFDFSAWHEKFGEGTLTLFVKRHGEDASYPVIPVIEQTTARWSISATDTAIYGSGSAELRYVVDGVIVKSETFPTFVYRSITETTAPAPDPYESWVETLVALGDKTRIYAKSAEAALSRAEEYATDSERAASESEASASAAKTSETNAKASEINAKASETNAQSSESTASQALADLLRMLGTDVATLVNGKIPVSQIPSIATVEIYHAASLEEMNALEVQRGDVCIRTDEDKSYIYSDGWVHLASPTDYASRSGYSDTAGVAENANTINGHRLVQIPWSQWESAVKDPDTYYLVYTEETE